jgi:hypothetical protein
VRWSAEIWCRSEQNQALQKSAKYDVSILTCRSERVNLVSTHKFLPKFDLWKTFFQTKTYFYVTVSCAPPPRRLFPSLWQSWRACCWHPKVKLLTLFILLQYMHLFSLKLETTWAPDVNRGFFTFYSGCPSHTKLYANSMVLYAVEICIPSVNLYITCSQI